MIRYCAAILSKPGRERPPPARAPAAARTKEAPEIVILDIGLPDMDGYELARRLRRLDATSMALLIAATGFGRREDRACSEEAGIDHHLVKPVDLNALEEIIRQPSLH
jgi:DNA-binding response OmpR family regulator